MTNWTKEIPTESGHYWVRDGDYVAIIELAKDGSFYEIGLETIWDVSGRNCEFSQKIEPPND